MTSQQKTARMRLPAHRIEATFAGRLTMAQLWAIPGVTQPQAEDHHLTCVVEGPVAPLLASLLRAGLIELDSRELPAAR